MTHVTEKDVGIAVDLIVDRDAWKAVAKAAISRLRELEMRDVQHERRYGRLLAEHRAVLDRLNTTKPATGGTVQASGTAAKGTHREYTASGAA